MNYKQFGESYHDAHQGVFQDGKYILPPIIPTIAYDGLDFPWNGDKNPDLLLAIYVTTHEKLHEYGIETPPGIWLELPTTQYAIDRTAHRLGVEDISDCYVYTEQSNVMSFENERIFAPNESLYEINTFAEILSSLRERDMLEKFDAVLEYEGQNVQNLPGVINTAANLDCYDHGPAIKCTEDLVFNKYGGSLVKIAKANFPDGKELLEQSGGKLTSFGFVARNDLPFEQVYEPPEPEQEQEMNM